MNGTWLYQAHVWALLAGLLSLLAVGCVEGDVVLYRDGRPAATIVTAADAPATVELAALEFRHHLKQATGRQLPRKTDAERVEGPVILVGESKRTRELGLRNDDFKRQEYLIQTRPDTLILMGHDRQVFGEVRYDDPLTPEEYIGSPGPNPGFPLYPGWTRFDAVGSCYAVYDFLERYCGVRWYLPGPRGTYVPERESLVVRNLNLKRKPWMVYREGTNYTDTTPRALYTGDRTKLDSPAGRPDLRVMPVEEVLPGRDTVLWALRNKAWGDRFHANHSYSSWEAAFKEGHPDWFAKGRVNKGLGLELCLSNPEVKERMIQDARDYFDGKQPVSTGALGDYFPIVPTDGKEWCLCQECQSKMDPPYDFDIRSMGGKAVIARSASRYVWDFIGEVADAVAESHPGKYICALAYTDYLVVPEDMKRRDNLAVMFCLQPTQTAFSPAFAQFNEEHLREWSRVAGGGVYVWIYTVYPQYRSGGRFPDLSYHKWAEWMRLFHKLGIKGYFDNADGGMVVSVPGTYNHVWPDPMEDFFRHYVALKLADDITIDEDELYDEFYRFWYGQAAEAIKGFVLKAQELYNDPHYKVDGRVQSQGYSPWRDILGVYHGEGVPWEDVVWGSVCTAENLQELGRYIAQAYELADTPEAKARVKLLDDGVYQGIVRGRSRWTPPTSMHREAYAAEPSAWRMRHASCPRVTVDTPGLARVIDWSVAGQLGNFILHTPRAGSPRESFPLSVGTDVEVMHDETYLYLRVVCQDPDTNSLLIDSGAVWAGDSVEIFLDPEGQGEFRQLIVNPRGDRAEFQSQRGERLRSWTSGVSIDTEILPTAPEIDDGRWIVRIAIPFASISGSPPQAGDTWRFNVCRNFRGNYEYSAWNPTVGGWQKPEYFGELKFVEAKY